MVVLDLLAKHTSVTKEVFFLFCLFVNNKARGICKKERSICTGGGIQPVPASPVLLSSSPWLKQDAA